MKKYLRNFLLLAIFLLPTAYTAYGMNPISISPNSHTLRLAPNTPHTIEFSTNPEEAEGRTSLGHMSGFRNHILNIPGLSAGTEVDIIVTFYYLHLEDFSEYEDYITIRVIIDNFAPPTTVSLSSSTIARGGGANLTASGGTGSGNLTFSTSGTWPQGVTINGNTLNVSNNAQLGTHNVQINVTREGLNAVTLPLSFTITETSGQAGNQNNNNQQNNQNQNNNNQQNNQNQNNQNNNDRPVWATEFTPEGDNLPPWAVRPGQTPIQPQPQEQVEQPQEPIGFDPTLPQGVIPPWSTSPSPAGFDDVLLNQWHYSYIMQVSDFFHGADQRSFYPDMNTTRAMFVYTLANMHNANTTGLISSFNDVSSSAWYADSVAWANNSGIVQGTGEGMFSPDSNITREQIAVMFLNFANFAEISLNSENASAFEDSSQISSWAIEAVGALSSAGIVAGRPDGTFDPQASVTRAETATMFARFLDLIETSLNS